MAQWERGPTKSFFYTRTTPRVVSQGDASKCWASSLESWLGVVVHDTGEKNGVWTGGDAKRNRVDGLPWKRTKLDLDDMKNLWGDLTNPDQSLTAEGIRVMALDVGMDGDIKLPIELTFDYFSHKLGTEGHLYIAYFSMHMYHAIVAYGFDTGPKELLVMDPNPDRGLIRRAVDFFKEPNRVNKLMLVGWAQ
jgi:hypothetical protein